MVWATVFKYWQSPLILVEQAVKINTDLYVNNIVVTTFEKMKIHFNNQSFTFNKMEHHPHLNKNSVLVQPSFSKTLE